MKARRKVLSTLTLALTAPLALWAAPTPLDSSQHASSESAYSLIYLDGHMHTTFSDGSGSVSDIKKTAISRGLDAVIITDHCEMLTKDEWPSLIAQTEQASDDSFLVLLGFEITGSEGIFNRDHILAYNAPDPFVGDDARELCPSEVWPSPPNPEGTGAVHPENLTRWVDYIHAQGGFTVHAHTAGSTRLTYSVDSIEVYNQSQINDIVDYAKLLGYSDEEALAFAMILSNFATYGERDANMPVDFPGFSEPIPLRLALHHVIGQWLGSPEAPLNSWDDLLMAYVDGTVRKPTFALAGSDAHNTAESDSDVGLGKNGLYVESLTAADVYAAIRAGRGFATTGPSLAFDVNGKLMGDTAYIPSGGSAHLKLSVDSENPSAVLVRIDIIRNGEVVQMVRPMSPTYDGRLIDSVSGRGYYRVEVTSYDPASGRQHFAWSNPVFVKCPGDRDCDGDSNFIETVLGSRSNDQASTPEHANFPATCGDGLDNDQDGLIDAADSGCQ